MKISPKPARKKKVKALTEQDNNEIKVEMKSPSTTSVIRKTKLEHMEIEIDTPATIDDEHFIIDDNITVESNIEIEFITSDELLPSEMETDAIDYDDSDRKYENNFGDEMGSQQDNDDDYDGGGNESWDNVRLKCFLFCFF